MTRKPQLRVRDRVAMLGKASMMRIRLILANGKFWSGVLAAASLSRGSAFIERPPQSQSVASGAIEAFIPYRAWGVILLVTAAGIVIGYSHKRLCIVGLFAHLLSVFAYVTFTVSTGAAAIGYGQSWANLGLLVTQSFLHVACAIYMGDEIARFRQEVRVE